ncbi:MAG: hypothetical protein ACREP4_05460 [Stenotrophomonas sp.]|uniref:hypothetical protein n=1 Tax=Stenotrophomonas sp. TaxID=69392 RepID=UPI003D6C8AAF
MSMFLGKPVPSRAIPLSIKIKIIRDVFSTEAGLAEDMSEALALCDFAEAEAEFRHALIHGVNAEIHKRDPWYTLIWRPEKSGGKHEASDILHITEKDLYNHYENVGYAGLAAVGIVSRLLKKMEDGLQ